MFEQLPASLPLHLLDILLHERFEALKIKPLHGLALVVVIIYHNLLQSGDMCLLKFLREDLFLKVDQILVIHDAVPIFIADPKDP